MLAKLVLLALTAAAPLERFDLVCGTNEKQPTHYRIDLAAGEWCWADCGGTSKIASVTSTRITFVDNAAGFSKALAFVDRTTGEYARLNVDRFGTLTVRGHCEPAPFSGFGTPRF